MPHLTRAEALMLLTADLVCLIFLSGAIQLIDPSIYFVSMGFYKGFIYLVGGLWLILFIRSLFGWEEDRYGKPTRLQNY